jgi:hypothetical protein
MARVVSDLAAASVSMLLLLRAILIFRVSGWR